MAGAERYPGTLLALGVVSAIHQARQSGRGEFVDVAMYDAITFLCETVIANYGFDGVSLGPRGSGHPNLCPFDLYPTADGSVAIAAPGQKHWQALCEARGREVSATTTGIYRRAPMLDEHCAEILAQFGIEPGPT